MQNKLEPFLMAAFFCITLFLLCASPLAPFAYFYPKADTAAYLVVGRGLSEGFLPYTAYWDNKGPVLYAWLAIGYKLGFGSTVGVWLLEIAVLFGTALFLYLALVRFSVRRSVAACGCILLLFATEMMFNDGLTCEELGNLMAALSIWIASRFKQREQGFYWEWFQLFWIGCLFALALLVRVNLTAMWLAVGSILFFYKLLKGQVKEAFVYAGSFALGAAFVLGICFFIFARNDAVDDMVFAIWQSSHALATKLPYIRLTEGLKTFFKVPFYGFSIVLSYFAVVSIRIYLKKENNLLFPVMLLGWLCINIFANSVSGFALNQYTVSYLLPTCICFCYLCMWLLPAEKGFVQGTAAPVVVSLFLLCTRLPDFSQKLIENTMRPGREENPVASYIQNNTAATDTVACVGFLPELTYLTDRKSPSRYFYVLTNNAMDQKNTALIIEEFFHDILLHKPEMIVETPSTRRFIELVWVGMENVDAYVALVASRYEEVLQQDGTVVYRQKPEK